MIGQMLEGTGYNCRASLRCEHEHVFAEMMNKKMNWDIVDTCRVSLLYELSYAPSDLMPEQIFLGIMNSRPVSLLCEFLSVSSG